MNEKERGTDWKGNERQHVVETQIEIVWIETATGIGGELEAETGIELTEISVGNQEGKRY